MCYPEKTGRCTIVGYFGKNLTQLNGDAVIKNYFKIVNIDLFSTYIFISMYYPMFEKIGQITFLFLLPDRQTDRYFIDRKEKSLQTYLS